MNVAARAVFGCTQLERAYVWWHWERNTTSGWDGDQARSLVNCASYFPQVCCVFIYAWIYLKIGADTWIAAAKPLSNRMDMEPWRGKYLSLVPVPVSFTIIITNCHNCHCRQESWKWPETVSNTLGKGFSPTWVMRGACMQSSRRLSLRTSLSMSMIGSRPIGPRTAAAGPCTVGPQTVWPRTVWPWTVGPRGPTVRPQTLTILYSLIKSIVLIETLSMLLLLHFQ